MSQIKVYRIMLWLIPFVFIPLLLGADTAFDLQYHDTYYVIAYIHIAPILLVILFLEGLIYWLLRDWKLVKTLSSVHWICTVICILGIVVLSMLQTHFRYKDVAFSRDLVEVGPLLLVVLVLVQFVFIINILIGLVRGRNE